MIVDCRFDYEYRGGHIKGALNLSDPQQMKEYFLKDRQTIERLMGTVIIFHCEFSQKRGPEMYSTLREIDRRLHMNVYPQLFFSEIYILEGGYKQFFENHPDLCEGGYVPMADKSYKEDCRDKFSKHKRDYQEFKANRSNFEIPNLISIQAEAEQVHAKSPSRFQIEEDEFFEDDEH